MTAVIAEPVTIPDDASSLDAPKVCEAEFECPDHGRERCNYRARFVVRGRCVDCGDRTRLWCVLHVLLAQIRPDAGGCGTCGGRVALLEVYRIGGES